MSAADPSATAPLIRQLGVRDYLPVWQEMQNFTEQRNADTADELWLVEHPPVFTLGLNGKAEHLLDPGDIPVVPCDRGGQVTYHGPGQAVIYLLLDLRRRNLGIKALVNKMEQAIIDLLAEHEIDGLRRDGAPGIYVDEKKIAALGLRVRRGCCYHGLSLNTAMDLTPFSRINPCGYQGLQSTQISELVDDSVVFSEIQQQLLSQLLIQLGH